MKIGRETSEEPSSPEDGSNFRRSLQIDMKSLIGSAIGNMSIGPGSRDVVLAARKGLFIIDLEAPLNVPRFLPQGGTWDVADVQWNPHFSRNEYIVSTSSEKLLIWNLYISGKTSIEFILRSHYRAITDINWHTMDPDVVVSTGIDSWLWSWDLRTPRKPVLGLCAFNAGGTQVKWNRQDGNILASSHANEALIWDRRKGSLPVSRIAAHSAKIYGIDWAHERRNELVTCSLDKTIKIWDVQNPKNAKDQFEPHHTIQTAYPVWRARDLPFGHGVMSLPQRGETALEMFTPESKNDPIERFEGHTDIVKEFVWRRGGPDDRDFQLITWSTDKTLRFWPVDQDVLVRAGERSLDEPDSVSSLHSEAIVTFSNPPMGSELPPKLSAPLGPRNMLGIVRAVDKSHLPKNLGIHEVSSPHIQDRESLSDAGVSRTNSSTIERKKNQPDRRKFVGGRDAQITTFAWLSSVKVGDKKEGSSGPGSGAESGTASRISSRSRPPSFHDIPPLQFTSADIRKRNDLKEKLDEERRDDGSQLQEEITSVVQKLNSSKLKLEKADVLKKRTCTFGLHGPWGESASVFIRITFTFPRDYPQAPHPVGTPQIDLERNPLVSMKTRVLMLRKLRAIRERQRPCLEACLRFLLFGDEDDFSSIHGLSAIDSESSSEDEAYPTTRRQRDGTISLLRGDKNLAEPRTSQGVFGPNGQLVCFFRAPPRIVRNVVREVSASPSIGSRGPDTGPRLFRSPSLLSDALHRLSLAANDRVVPTLGEKRTEDVNSILRIMSNLFTFSHTKVRKFSEQSKQVEELPLTYSLLPTRRSSVFINDTSAFIGLDVDAAGSYVYPATNPSDWCKVNSGIARTHGRVDHERIFTMMQVMLLEGQKSALPLEMASTHTFTPLMMRFIEKMYTELLANKDAQMLAMLSIMLLGLYGMKDHPFSVPFPSPGSPFNVDADYFNFAGRFMRRKDSGHLPHWSRISPSPTSHPMAPSLDSPSSSRGSWSSLFNASNMRRFMSGTTPRPPPLSVPPLGRPVSPTQHSRARIQTNGSPRTPRTPSGGASTTHNHSSWTESNNVSARGRGLPNISLPPSIQSNLRRPTFSQVVSTGSSADRKRIHVDINNKLKTPMTSTFKLHTQLRQQLACHILSYAEMLSAWGYPTKRSELLKSVEEELRVILNPVLVDTILESSPIGVVRICERCQHENQMDVEFCLTCKVRLSRDRCTVCRLPIKGLSHTCLLCLHDTHVQCWTARQDSSCATGCGCVCKSEIDDDIGSGLVDSLLHFPPSIKSMRLGRNGFDS
ncbi:hypothetical protein C8Q75DRAFT_847958 [Abortiporus biennis]|nr:hypothetical protein C8Q75DRAFT_847958 [Abortiporus biennis]